MLPSFSVQFAADTLFHTTKHPRHADADYDHFLATRPIAPAQVYPWFLRLLPSALRGPLNARLVARRHEKLLIATWQNSPHLLADMGVILTRNSDLPEHLSAAPQSLIDLVAELAPEQIVRTEREFPPRADSATPLTTEVTSFQDRPAPIGAARFPAEIPA